MANRIFYQEDCNLGLLDGKTIAIIGYGSLIIIPHRKRNVNIEFEIF